MGYFKGKAVGYDDGYSVGQEVGYDLGNTDGYSLGEQSGLEEGYASGKADGYADGYKEGMEVGLGHGYTLRDPTYKQIIIFLSKDKPDENEYIEGTYVCSHFARDVGNNAEAQGFRCAYVHIFYPEGGHSIIAFNTIDKGLIYFEPQSDEKTRPVLGKYYYQCIEPEPGFHYKKPLYDDTIKDILVIW